MLKLVYTLVTLQKPANIFVDFGKQKSFLIKNFSLFSIDGNDSKVGQLTENEKMRKYSFNHIKSTFVISSLSKTQISSLIVF